VLVATIIVSLLLFLVPVLLNLVRRSPGDGLTQSPWIKASAEMTGLEQLARITVERGEKLLHESVARRRAEEDLQVSSSLLTQSQEERARLGRELHDNICQTLYAVCLTLESVRRKISATPDVWQRLEQSIGELRRLNQEVRAYLTELDPEQIHVQSFTDAVSQMLDVLPVSNDLKISRLLDEEVVAQIRPAQTAEVVNILREAISNASRHGHARHITIRAEQDENMLALAVQDDGIGFPDGVPHNSTGHGLGNMQARATAIGGSLKVDSSPGKGTRVVLLLPVASPTA
jgi:signal transduction histidine kinase